MIPNKQEIDNDNETFKNFKCNLTGTHHIIERMISYKYVKAQKQEIKVKKRGYL